jgi:hypothetical protein
MLISLKWLGIGLTAEEKEAKERRKQEELARRELYRQLAEEAAYVADLIRRRLVELGICYRYKKTDRRGLMSSEVRPIDFERVTATPEAHYLRVNTRTMPRGVTVANLYHEDVIEALGYSIGTEVGYKAGKDVGFWYVVPRKGRLGGIPRLVKYADALAAIPATAPTLAFPVGFGENSKFAWDDLEAVTNLLLGGSKGGGKSNALNMILCTLIQRAGKDDLRLFLVDLKAGMEFIYYAGIPQLGGDIPWTDPKTNEEIENPFSKIMIHGQTTIKMLEYVLEEIQRRGNVLRGKAKKLGVWNKRYRKSKMPYWVVVIDELGDLMLDRRYRTKAENLLSRISQLGRAVGIHLILATQTPNKDTVPRLLKNNLDARLAFRCADGPSSQIVVDNYDASYIPKIPGRMLYVGGHHTSMERMEVQTPFIGDAMVKDIVHRVKGGNVDISLAKEHDVTTEDLFRWALENGGNFSYRAVWEAFRKRGITQNQVMQIAREFQLSEEDEHEPRIEIDDQIYHLTRKEEHKAGSAPRELVLCAFCNENAGEQGDTDAVEKVLEEDEIFSEDEETPEKLYGTTDEWDSDGTEGDSGVGVWGTDDSEGDAGGEIGEWQPDADGDGVVSDGDDLNQWLDGIVDQAMGHRGKGGRRR